MEFIVRPSEIKDAGVGVFALKDIEPGERLILEGVTPLFAYKDLEEVSDDFLKYCPLLPNGKFLCPENFHQMNIFWYLNHSNTPNMDWTKIGFFANRKIVRGEELTIFYPDLETHPKNKLWNKKYVEELRRKVS